MVQHRDRRSSTIILVLVLVLMVPVLARTVLGTAFLVICVALVTWIVARNKSRVPRQSPSLCTEAEDMNESRSVSEYTLSDFNFKQYRGATWTWPERPLVHGAFSEVYRSTSLGSVDPDKYWIPKGKSVQVGGYTISCGLFYLGTDLPSLCSDRVEPSLVNPNLRPNRTAVDYTVKNLGYWPSYSDASGIARASYLAWLAEGLPDRNPDPGYVFLYFYGLERRALADSQVSTLAVSELSEIRETVQWLLHVAQSSCSFQNYGRRFLEIFDARRRGIPRIDPDSYLAGSSPRYITLPLRVELGSAAKRSIPLSSDLAHAWYLSEPTTTIRTPARRCPKQFRELFKLEYGNHFGSGMVIPAIKTEIVAQYQTASSSFGPASIEMSLDLPDVTLLKNPIRSLDEIGEICAKKLEPFSRYCAKSPDQAEPHEEVVFLPSSLWPDGSQLYLREIKNRVAQSAGFWKVPFSELLDGLGFVCSKKASYEAMTRGFEENGIGIEPDQRYGGKLPNGTDPVVLFKLAKDTSEAFSITSLFSGALALQLASAAALADGDFREEEQDAMIKHLGTWLSLSYADLVRLKAMLELLKVQSPKLTGLKKKLNGLDPAARSQLGDFMVHIVKADNIITPDEVKVLEKIFYMLGLGAQELYGRLQGVATEPVSIRSPIPGVSGYAIPEPADLSTTTETRLDMDKVEALKVDSARAALLLGAVFSESREELETETDESAECDVDSQRLLDLDLEHSQLLAVLLSRAEWSREEFSEICLDHGLMVDGAIERINEASFEKVQQAIIEGDDPLEVRQDLLSEVGA